jgi:succinylglutamate desuccinylase
VAGEPARVIGRVRGAQPGPLLLVVAGIHGNEPAGVRAAERVQPRLAELAGRMQGDFLALRGNVRALAQGRRYLHEDLNRRWTDAQLHRLRARSLAADAVPEEHEQAELLTELDVALEGARGPVTFLDLHTTSADGIPFSMIARAARPDDLALRLPLTVIVGLLEQVHGVLLESMRRRGCTCLGVEAGQNESPDSVDRHEAVLWAAATVAGLLEPQLVEDLPRHQALLEQARAGRPRLIEVHARYAIAPQDAFRMEPGFSNIERVRRGQLLAHDRTGEVRAPLDGVLLLPLYQAQGEEGFFLGREVAL